MGREWSQCGAGVLRHLREELEEGSVEVLLEVSVALTAGAAEQRHRGAHHEVVLEEAADAGVDRGDPLGVALANVLVQRALQLGEEGGRLLRLARRGQVARRLAQQVPLPLDARQQRLGPECGAGVARVVAVNGGRLRLEAVEGVLDQAHLRDVLVVHLRGLFLDAPQDGLAPSQ